GCRAHDDLLYQRGRGIFAAMGAPVRLDDERSLTSCQWRGFAGPAECLDRRWGVDEADAACVKRRVRGTICPTEVARCDYVHGARGDLGKAARTEGRNIVVEVSSITERKSSVCVLGVQAELRASADRDHVRVGGGRAESAYCARVPSADNDGYAGVYRFGIGERYWVVRIVGKKVAAERLVDHVDVVVKHSIFNCLNEIGVGAESQIRKRLQPYQRCPRSHTSDANAAGRGQRVGGADELANIED